MTALSIKSPHGSKEAQGTCVTWADSAIQKIPILHAGALAVESILTHPKTLFLSVNRGGELSNNRGREAWRIGP